MDLYATFALDVLPLALELLHHLLPHKQTLIGQFFHSRLRLLLELIQSESSLDYLSFAHKEFKLVVGSVSLVHSPVLLDSYCS